MITKTERKKLKKILGDHYTDHIITELKRLGVLNKYHRTPTANQIRVVFGGHAEHKAIENAIFAAYNKVRQEKQRIKDKRKAILAKK